MSLRDEIEALRPVCLDTKQIDVCLLELEELEAKAKVLERNNEHLSSLLEARQNDAFEADARVEQLEREIGVLNFAAENRWKRMEKLEEALHEMEGRNEQQMREIARRALQD